MVRTLALAGLLAIMAAALVATVTGVVGGVGTPARTSPDRPAPTQEPGTPDETFYVVAHHWNWAVFTENGTELDKIRAKEGSTLELYAVNALAQDAIEKLPAPVAKAIRAKAGLTFAPPAEADPLWPYMEDHGLLLAWYGVIEYLDNDAQDPTRVVFTADTPGEYEFVCTNYCGLGHKFMHQIKLIVE